MQSAVGLKNWILSVFCNFYQSCLRIYQKELYRLSIPADLLFWTDKSKLNLGEREQTSQSLFSARYGYNHHHSLVTSPPDSDTQKYLE